ncbi:MAG: Dam family site-specific DNA-(adenine-N6)-methyltransferase [Blautia sp.]|nr:Dam family site-specific DNA-(adenine-N6)-methyltransferase [Lachnoclostridium sp.]MCM1212349.1 Dam family site-specific DNA-(adenine-N6)-methyltransferase [Blautia sp.]
MMKAPHLVQYQGSKRIIAPEILKFFPAKFERLIEPFSGTCAVSILAALENRCDNFWINDINKPLITMLEKCINTPQELIDEYSVIWNGQFAENQNNIDYFYKVRDEFNNGMQDAARMLFLLARIVKGAIRYNMQGNLNQSCDKRRYGTKPEIMAGNAFRISELLKEKTIFSSMDYKEVLAMAAPGELIYMDPPYQGTSDRDNSRDNRYIQGVDFEEFIEELDKLNKKNIDFIVSYDGMTGDKVIGKDLPRSLELKHMYINAGVSTQATLNGKMEITYESLYISKNLICTQDKYEQMELCLA